MAVRGKVAEEMAKEVQRIAATVPYDRKRKCLRGSVKTGDLVRFLGTQLLTDDYINVMMHILVDNLDKNGGQQSTRRILVASLHFSNDITNLKLPEEKWKTTLALRRESRMKTLTSSTSLSTSTRITGWQVQSTSGRIPFRRMRQSARY